MFKHVFLLWHFDLSKCIWIIYTLIIIRLCAPLKACVTILRPSLVRFGLTVTSVIICFMMHASFFLSSRLKMYQMWCIKPIIKNYLSFCDILFKWQFGYFRSFFFGMKNCTILMKMNVQAGPIWYNQLTKKLKIWISSQFKKYTLSQDICFANCVLQFRCHFSSDFSHISPVYILADKRKDTQYICQIIQ